MTIHTTRTGLEIAVIGMAGSFPGAADIEAFWANLLGGQDAISRLGDDELAAAGVHPALLAMPNFVRAKGLFPDLDCFDAAFFDYTPRDAALLDPQARLLHQCVYHALEDAGCLGGQRGAGIGLFVGASGNFTWELGTLLDTRGSAATQFAAKQLNDKDFIATRIAYKLDLRGPCATLHTACSTSLYAIDTACRQLLTGACSVAVAAGSGLTLPHRNGYVFEEGMILSPDGTCRPFSDDANGTVEGNGMGAVVLKPLEDALRDRDRIYAVIRGSAANNDGARKVGYTAPSVEGQAEAIRRALHMADVEPASISYVEAHGTGTALGDPVEIEGLKQAFRGAPAGACGIGSLKSAIGHLDTAAGISSFIKTVLALRERRIPPSLHFRAPNPKIAFDGSPFRVVDRLTEWQRPATGRGDEVWPLRAGVSSFGIGGTNVHVVLEEAPEQPSSTPGRDWQVLCLSAADEAALARLEAALADHLERHPDTDPADLAYTLQTGRRAMPARSTLAWRDSAGLAAALRSGAGLRRARAAGSSRVAFLFPGQGTQYPGMGAGLYRDEPVFRDALERCLAESDRLGLPEVRRLLLTAAPAEGDAALMARTDLAQPCLFAVEYALAALLTDWGLAPAAMIGHSLGEYTAACVAGAMTPAQAMELVAERGRLMNAMPPGAMLAVAAPASEVAALLPAGVELAAVNGPAQCTVAGPADAIDAVAALFAGKGLQARRLHTSHAYHTEAMAPAAEALAACVGRMTLQLPAIPYVSNVTGTWITAAEVGDPAYYARHLRGTVRFADGMRTLLEEGDLVLVEVGPGNVLSAFARAVAEAAGRTDPGDLTAVPAMRHARQDMPDSQALAQALGALWCAGVAPDWRGYYRGQLRSRVALPRYPFARQRFPVGDRDIYRLLESVAQPGAQDTAGAHAARPADGTHVFAWQPAPLPPADEPATVRPCLALVEDRGALQALDRVGGLRIDAALPGGRFAPAGPGRYTWSADRATDHRRLVRHLKSVDGMPPLLAWLAGATVRDADAARRLLGCLLRLARVLHAECPGQRFRAVALLDRCRLADPAGAELAALLDAGLRAIRASCPGIDLRCVAVAGRGREALTQALASELFDPAGDTVLAAWDDGRRAVFGLCATAPVAAPSAAGKTIGLLAPDRLPVAALAARLSALGGARVLPLPCRAPQERRRPSSLAIDGAALRRHLGDARGRDLSRYGLHDFARCHALMDEAATSLVARYVHAALPLVPGRRFTRAELKSALRITDRLERYVDYFLAMFVEDGIVATTAEGAGVSKADDEGAMYAVRRHAGDLRPFEAVRDELVAASSLFAGNLEILAHCVRAFPQALSEEVPPISVLYPDGRNDMLLKAYAGSIQALQEDVVRVVFEHLVRQLIAAAGNRPLRILEGGGGFGLTMRRIAPMLRGMQVEYYFTDVGKTFLHDAREFALREGHDFLTFGVFDISKDPVEQGLEEGSFDLVFAFNVVHATRNIGTSVGHLRRLLRDGGLMCLLERTVVRRYIDLIWGLADGWWHFDRSERALSPLIGLDRWEAIARDAGFADVMSYPAEPADRQRLEVGILVAQAGHGTQPHAADDGWQLPAPPAGTTLDGVIVVDAPRDRPRDPFEPLGDALAVPRLTGRRFGQALQAWLARHRPPVCSVWSAGDALADGADRLARALDAAEIDRAGRALLGAGAWSRLQLPATGDAMPADGVLAAAWQATAGGLAQAVVAPAAQDLFAPRRTGAVPPSVEGDGAAEDGASRTDAAHGGMPRDAQGYAVLLHGLWAQLFGIERIGHDDDFFELGGDSLKVAQLTAELERHGIRLLANEVFNRPTIRGLAHYLHENRAQEHGDIRGSAALAEHLSAALGVPVRAPALRWQERTFRLLLVEGGDADQTRIESLLRDLRLPPEVEPHCVALLPAGGGSFQAGSDAAWQALGLRELDAAAADATAAALAAGVDAAMRRLSDGLRTAPVEASYPLSPFQKMFLRESNRFAFYMIDFDEPVDTALLGRALGDIVRAQGLMRSTLRRRGFGRHLWDEHAPPADDPALPFVDLSGYAPATQAQLFDRLMALENAADFDAAPGVMWRAMLVRFDRLRHTLLFNLDHSIFDNMSGQVLRRQLLNRYRALRAGSRAPMEAVKSYRHYLDQLNRGPLGITPKRLVELFELEDYEKAKDAVEARIAARRQPSIARMRYALDLDRWRLSDDDDAAWDLTLSLLTCALARFLEQEAVPLKLVYQGRQYQDLSYFDTLGLFIDVLPLLVRADRAQPSTMTESVRRKVRWVNRYNISFMNMLLNLRMRFRWWDVLGRLDPKKIDRRDPMILLNYVGRAEEEYQKVIEFSSRQMEESAGKPGYASLYAVVTVVDRQIRFDVFCNFEKDMDRLRAIFEEEAALLFRPVPEQEAAAQRDAGVAAAHAAAGALPVGAAELAVTE